MDAVSGWPEAIHQALGELGVRQVGLRARMPATRA